MSRINKHKHVMNMDGDYDPPTDNQQYARIMKSRGNNLHEVEPAVIECDSEPILSFLVSMPPKFRKNIWVKRGSIVIIEKIAEGDKVRGEIVRVLMADHIKDLKKLSSWPEKFNRPIGASASPKTEEPPKCHDNGTSDSDDVDEPYIGNRTKWQVSANDENSDDECSETESDEDEEPEDSEEEAVTDKLEQTVEQLTNTVASTKIQTN